MAYFSKFTGAEVDERLGLAELSYQKPTDGIPLSDLNSSELNRLKPMPVTIEIGTYADSDGITKVERTSRARTNIISRANLVGHGILPPEGYYFYTFLLDENFNKVGTVNWISTSLSPLKINDLSSDVVYLTMAIKNSYNGTDDITSDDLSVLTNWAQTTLSPISNANVYQYAILANHGIDNAITIDNGIIRIQAAGFGIVWKGVKYYVANTDTSATTPYEFNIGQYSNHYLVLKTNALKNVDARTELSEVISMRPYLNDGDIPIAYHYLDKQVVLLGQFKDLYGDNSTDTTIPDTEYTLQSNYGTDGVIVVRNSHIYIAATGFGIWHGGKLYYVANPDTAATDVYDFNLGGASHRYLVLDPQKLKNENARNDLAEVVSVKNYISRGDIPIAYVYYDSEVILLGQFKDLYGANNTDTKLDNTTINADIFFAPDYYSFCRGKKLNSEGEGTAWFKRFTLAHFTDIHNFYDLFAEGLNVVQSKVNAVINCGDDSQGVTADDVPIIKEDLQDIMNVVSQNNQLPYIPNVGNHDFTGLTKQEYFDIVCANISGITWGNEAGYRTYGYIDFTDSTYEGNYRIIMLDPFDYNDGQYSNPYYNMYVVFSQNQINWLIDTLEDAASKGLNVITTMHFSFGDNNLPFGEELAKPDAHYCQDAFMIPDIIKAIQNKATLNKTYIDSQGGNNISINKDFTDVAQLKYVCHLFGHIHSKNAYQCQKTNGEKYDMLMLGELSLAQNGVALAKTYREQGTVNNMSFSVLAIDSEEEAIYRISYGAFRSYNNVADNRVTKISYRLSVDENASSIINSSVSIDELSERVAILENQLAAMQ